MSSDRDPRYSRSGQIVGTVLIVALGGAVVIFFAFTAATRPNSNPLPFLALLGAVGAFGQFARSIWDSFRRNREITVWDSVAWAFILMAASGTALYLFAHPEA